MTERANEPRTDRAFIDYRFSEIIKRLDRIDTNMGVYAKQTDHDKLASTVSELSKDIRDNYVKKENLRWIQYIVAGMAISVGSYLVIQLFQAIGGRP